MGHWIHGFMRNVGFGEVLLAEAWGLASGLQLAKDLNITHLMVESDSAVLINLLQSRDLDNHPLGTILLNCKSLMSTFHSFSLSHILRERNMVADTLAKRSIDQEIGLCLLPSMIGFLSSVVIDDLSGLAHPRLVSAALAAS
jgi:hypothetical protein